MYAQHVVISTRLVEMLRIHGKIRMGPVMQRWAGGPVIPPITDSVEHGYVVVVPRTSHFPKIIDMINATFLWDHVGLFLDDAIRPLLLSLEEDHS